LGKLESGAEFRIAVAFNLKYRPSGLFAPDAQAWVGISFPERIYDHLKTPRPEIGPALERYRAAFSKTSKASPTCAHWISCTWRNGDAVSDVRASQVPVGIALVPRQNVNRHYYKERSIGFGELASLLVAIAPEEVPLQYRPGATTRPMIGRACI